jgi:hypothetical protein
MPFGNTLFGRRNFVTALKRTLGSSKREMLAVPKVSPQDALNEEKKTA